MRGTSHAQRRICLATLRKWLETQFLWIFSCAGVTSPAVMSPAGGPSTNPAGRRPVVAPAPAAQSVALVALTRLELRSRFAIFFLLRELQSYPRAQPPHSMIGQSSRNITEWHH